MPSIPVPAARSGAGRYSPCGACRALRWALRLSVPRRGLCRTRFHFFPPRIRRFQRPVAGLSASKVPALPVPCSFRHYSLQCQLFSIALSEMDSLETDNAIVDPYWIYHI